MNDDPADFIGVDLGIVNIATTSTGKNFSGKQMNHRRRENNVRRARLHQRGTRSSKRRLIKESGREARFAANVNHAIAKEIVTEAKHTGQGIALEDLEGILARARSRKPQRVTLHSWSFHQLGAFIAYKAKIAGVPVVHVDPAYTSQQCAKCRHIAKENRPTRDTFCCIRCGWSLPADENASLNIAQRGVEVWAVSHAAERNTLLAV